MSGKWHYLSNQILVATEGSFKLMLILLKDHAAKLRGGSTDPDIDVLRARFDPIEEAYLDALSLWTNAKAFYKGATLAFEILLKELSSKKIRDWDVQIQVVYSKDTEEYISLLPNGRNPFQKGSYEIIISHVGALAKTLALYPVLAATKTDVENFYAQLLSTRETQQVKEALVKSKSEALEKARVEAAVTMYGNLGVLMDKFRYNTEHVKRFFELHLIKSPPKDKNTFSGELAGGDMGVAVSGIKDKNVFTLYNNGDTPLLFFTSANATDAVNGAGFRLEPHTSTAKTALELGDAGNKFLKVKNLSENIQGTWAVIKK